MSLRSIFTANTAAGKIAGVMAASIMLQACGTLQSAKTTAGIGDDKYREAIGVYSSDDPGENLDPIAAAAFWGTRFNTDQDDPMVAVNFSKALRKIGSLDEAVNVMQKMEGYTAENADVSLEYGKVLVENGRAFEAVRHLENAVEQKPSDWTALSAYGVALDQIGEHKAARQSYDRALAANPNHKSIMNNKGLSYALDGKLGLAESTLRKAASNAGSDSRIRQNLALVLALGGKLTEAERLARSDLPPRVAENNIGFFRQLLSQPAYWGEYASVDSDIPSFDEPVSAAPEIKSDPTPAKPTLKEQPKFDEPETDDNAPIALNEAAPVVNTSAVVADVEQGPTSLIAPAAPAIEVSNDNVEVANDVDLLSLPSLKNDNE